MGTIEVSVVERVAILEGILAAKQNGDDIKVSIFIFLLSSFWK